MTIEEYAADVARTTKHFDSFRDALTYAALSITGEAGETSELIKKHLFQSHPLNTQRLLDEAGDVLWSIVLLCNILGVSLEAVMEQNQCKRRERYPDGWTAERDINRTI